MHNIHTRILFALFVMLCLLAACASPPPRAETEPVTAALMTESTVETPPREESPSAALKFERIEAESIDCIALHFRLVMRNPRSQAVDFSITDWNCLLDGTALAPDAAVLASAGTSTAGLRWNAAAFTAIEENLILSLDLTGVLSGDAFPDGDDFLAELRITFDEPLIGDVSAQTVFPRIREPQFTITSIVIVQADLINTRFKVNLKIDNPNVFPVSLASFDYDLYGDGRFWGDGTVKNVLPVPAHSASETDFEFEMNFINMKRRLLDDIIALRRVRYRFAGEVSVETEVPWLPVFRTHFERSGNAEVKQK